MLKNPRLQLLAIFLGTVVVTFGVLLIASTAVNTIPPTAAPLPLPTMPPLLPTPNPTAVSIASQCSTTGENYELRFGEWDTGSNTQAYATYTSPDEKYEFYKEGDYVYVKDQKGKAKRLANDVPYTDIVGRVFWSPDSRHVLMTPNPDNRAVIFDADSGKAIVLSEIDNPYDFMGWTPHGNAAIFNNSNYHSISLWSAETGEHLYSTSAILVATQWSPDGNWLAYLWFDNTTQPYLHGIDIVSADGAVDHHKTLFTAPDSSFYALASDTILNWSPDSRYLALHYRLTGDEIYRHLVILNHDGSMLPNTDSLISTGESVIQSLNPSPDIVNTAAHWSQDGQRYIYLRTLNASQFELMAYTPDTSKNDILATNLYKPPFYAPSGKQMGLYTRSDDLFSIHLTDLNAENPVTLVENATDAGNPDWSPDGKWVAAVWAEGKGSSRKIHLTWMHPDGSGRQDIAANFKDVRELRWMKNDTLGYIDWHGSDGNSIETVNLETGGRTVLAIELETVTNPDYDADSDTLSFWWKTDSVTFGKDAYHSNGTQLYHVVATGDFDRPREEFWSLDGKSVALKLQAIPYSGQFDQQLVLAYADGRPPVLARVGLDGLDAPFWSPDSRMVAFLQWVRGDGVVPNPIGLAVISADGQSLWYQDNFPAGPPLEWAACGA